MREVLSCNVPGSYKKETLNDMIREGEDYRFEDEPESLLKELKGLRDSIFLLEKEVKGILSRRKAVVLKELKEWRSELSKCLVQLPISREFEEVVGSAESWLAEVELVTKREQASVPYLHEIRELVRTGNDLRLSLPELNVLTTQVEAAKNWISQLQHAFLRKAVQITLMEVSTLGTIYL